MYFFSWIRCPLWARVAWGWQNFHGQIKITGPGQKKITRAGPGRKTIARPGRAGQLFLAARPDGPGRPAANYGSDPNIQKQ